VILRDFTDPQGGFFDTGFQPMGLPVRPRGLQDSPVPSGSSMAVSLFLRLEALTGEARYREAALPPLTALQEMAARYPTAFSGWLIDMDLATAPLPQLAIAGEAHSPAFRALAHQAFDRFLPRLVVAGGDPADPAAPILLRGKPLEPEPTAYFCRDFICLRPTTDPEVLRNQLTDAV
jgi:uncharacterized protein YyaL (SSP411 family)